MHHFYGRVLQQAGIAASDGGPLAEFVAYVLSPAGAHWCGGDCTAMLQAALTDAVSDLTAPLRQRSRAVALGRGASGSLRPSDAAPAAHPGRA